MMMALPFISIRALIAALLHSVACQPRAFYDPSQKRGEFHWPVSSANWRRSWPQTLSATPA
jgi:hypothetical protein